MFDRGIRALCSAIPRSAYWCRGSRRLRGRSRNGPLQEALSARKLFCGRTVREQQASGYSYGDYCDLIMLSFHPPPSSVLPRAPRVAHLSLPRDRQTAQPPHDKQARGRDACSSRAAWPSEAPCSWRHGRSPADTPPAGQDALDKHHPRRRCSDAACEFSLGVTDAQGVLAARLDYATCAPDGLAADAGFSVNSFPNRTPCGADVEHDKNVPVCVDPSAFCSPHPWLRTARFQRRNHPSQSRTSDFQ